MTEGVQQSAIERVIAALDHECQVHEHCRDPHDIEPPAAVRSAEIIGFHRGLHYAIQLLRAEGGQS